MSNWQKTYPLGSSYFSQQEYATERPDQAQSWEHVVRHQGASYIQNGSVMWSGGFVQPPRHVPSCF